MSKILEQIEEQLEGKVWDMPRRGNELMEEIITYIQTNDKAFEVMLADVLEIIFYSGCDYPTIGLMSEYLRVKYDQKTPE